MVWRVRLRAEDGMIRAMPTGPGLARPPARGRRLRTILQKVWDSGTSACARKTARVPRGHCARRRRVRLRAEDGCVQSCKKYGIQARPPARGRRLVLGDGLDREQGTSACARKTGDHMPCAAADRGHVRLRAEDGGPAHRADRMPGARPPARGRRVEGIFSQHVLDGTSACARKTVHRRKSALVGQRRVRLRAEDGASAIWSRIPSRARPPARGRRPGRSASAAGVPVERRPGDDPALPARRRRTGSSSAAARRWRRRQCCRSSFATASRFGRPRSEGIFPKYAGLPAAAALFSR